MKQLFGVVLAVCCISAFAQAPVKVPVGVAKLVRPILGPMAEWQKCEESPRAPKCDDVAEPAARAFEELAEKKGTATDEALVVLSGFYFGTQQGEELRCIVAERGKRMLPLLKKYEACRTDLHSQYPEGIHEPTESCQARIELMRRAIRNYKSECESVD
jgi:hypothetical protein